MVRSVSRARVSPGGLSRPEVHTARLLLRPIDSADLAALHEIWRDPEVARYLWDGEEISRDSAAEALRKLISAFEYRGLPNWSVMHRASERLVGQCGIHLLEDLEESELVCSLHPDFRGRGLGTEAARATLRYAFSETHLERVVGISDTENAASRRMLEKLGLGYEQTAEYEGRPERWYAISREQFVPDRSLYLVRR